MRILPSFCLFFAAAGAGWSACRDCAEGALGGPGANPFTHFDAAVRNSPVFPDVFINTANLNVHLAASGPRLGPARGLALERSYNSDGAASGPFGNWSSNLTETLTPDAARKVWTLRRGSGKLDSFGPTADAGAFFALTATADRLAANPDGGYTLTTASGTRTFRSDGRLAAIQEPDFSAALEYDSAGRLTAARAFGRTLQFDYDGQNRIARVADGAGGSVSFTYTAGGALAGETRSNGVSITYEYDDAGRLAGLVAGETALRIAYGADPDSVTVTLPDGSTRRWEAAGAARQVRAIAGDGAATVYASTPLGQLESVTDPAGNRATYAYDGAGRRTRAVNAAGEVTRYEYNASGNLTAIVLPGGSRWSAEYSGGALARVQDPKGNAWSFRYAGGRPIAASDPLSATTTVERDTAGRIFSVTDPNGNTCYYEYSAGLLSAFTDALGLRRVWQYDAAGQPAARTDPDGSTLAAARQSSVTRDALGRVAESAGVKYEYDAAGRLAAIRLEAGTIQYSYDAAGRLAGVADWAGNFAVYRYDAAGSVQSVMVSGGPITVYQYDAARNLRSVISTGADGAVVAGFRYNRDGAGNATAVASQEPAPGVPAIASGSLIYDGANRLVWRDDGTGFRYDARGNLAAIEGPAPAELAWDAAGRLAGFRGASYSYDPASLRVERAAASGVRRYIYDRSGPQPRLLAETGADGAPIAWYVWGLGPLWKLEASGKAFFYHLDGEGNVAAMSSATEGVVNRYRYDPLGRLASSRESVENPLRARAAAGWIDDGDGVIYTGSAYRLPEFGISLNADGGIEPPLPALPGPTGPGAAFLTGGLR
ncbi:MAG: hypothetical protein ACE15B_24755 [Bryobacteraceae bacterium]